MNARLDSSAAQDLMGEFGIDPVAQAALFLHVAIFLTPNSIVGDDVFRLVSFQGQESTSELFEYELELHANTTTVDSGAQPFAMDDLIGLSITVGIDYPSNSPQSGSTLRFNSAVAGKSAVNSGSQDSGADMAFFNGIIASFSMEDQGVYRLTMKPSMARLELTNAYVLHSQLNVSDAIANVLGQYNISCSMQLRNLAISRQQDWLQAGENDYDFIRRLMAKAHVYFYFIHSAVSHTVVFANVPDYPPIHAEAPSFRYTGTDIDALGASQVDVITNYRYQRSLTSSAVNGRFTREYAMWETQPYQSYHTKDALAPMTPSDLPFELYKSYQYGDVDDEAEEFTDATRAALEAESIKFSGTGYCAHFRVGHQFSLAGLASQTALSGNLNDFNVIRPSFAGQNLVLTQVKHQAGADGGYSNQFQATKASGLISKFTLQETQQGSLLAIVRSVEAGDSAPGNWQHFAPINFDPELGIAIDSNATPAAFQPVGVYVNFCTDENGQPPVFIKLSSSMQTVPEVGAIVMIGRAQDESELPEVQNVVCTDGSKCILPTGWDANTHVGNSYTTTYADRQSISFGQYSVANLGKAVGIVTGQYATGQFGSTSYAQGASYSFSVSEGTAASFAQNDAELWGPYQSEGAGDLLNASESSGSSYSRQYAAVTSSFSNIGISYSNSTLGMSESHALTSGTTYSDSTQNGDITTISTVNADSSSTTTQTGNITTTNTVVGNTSNTSSNTGNITTTNTVVGDTTNTSANTGNITTTNTVIGDTTNTNTNTGNITTNTTVNGNTNNTSTNNGDITTTNTVNGDTTNTSTDNGDVTTTTTQHGKITSNTTQTDAVTNITTQGGVVTNVTTQGGLVTNTTTQLAAVIDTTTQLGAVVSTTTQMGVVNTTTTQMGAVNNTSIQLGVFNESKINAGPRFVDGAAPEDVTTSTTAEKTISEIHGLVTFFYNYDAGTITTIKPGVEENIVSGMTTHIVDLYIFM